MKTAAKIFTILGMVIGALAIYPIIVGLLALNKMKKATCKKDLTVWAIANLILCSPIGGILMLLLKDEDFAPAE